MGYFFFILGCLIGAGAGWGLTYLYFKRDKVRARIAAEIAAAKAKI
jgi:hypothetical protein